MPDIEREIELLNAEIEKAKAAIAVAQLKRRETNRDSPLVNDLNAAVAAAREKLGEVEIRLRQLYESKSDED